MTNWKSTLNLIKFSHTIFALPFALSMAVILYDKITLLKLTAIIICLVSARTSAMAFNRYIDANIDAVNPRTKNREIPAGIVEKKSAFLLAIISALVFFLSSWAIGVHCLLLSPIVIVILLGYSLTKRFTVLSHYVLGLALALAPGGVWYALTAKFAIEPVFLMLAVLFWVAGFDIIYSIQDLEFDKSHKLFSVPAKFGQNRALIISRLSHFFSVIFLILFGLVLELSKLYFIGVTLFALILIFQQLKIAGTDPKNIEPVFFTHNGIASIIFFVFVVLSKTF